MSPEEARIYAAIGGCEGRGCPWDGVVEVQYHNTAGPTKRACREHAAPYRQSLRGARQVEHIDPNEFAVRDSGRPNRRIWDGPAMTGRTMTPLFTREELSRAKESPAAFISRLDKELATISGLNELLRGNSNA